MASIPLLLIVFRLAWPLLGLPALGRARRCVAGFRRTSMYACEVLLRCTRRRAMPGSPGHGGAATTNHAPVLARSREGVLCVRF